MDNWRDRQRRTFDVGYQLEPTGGDNVTATFRSSFGGLTMAGATMAVARSCPDKALHSAHTWFLRPVPAGVPVEMRIERVRDGRMLSHRRVQLLHEDKLLCEMTLSFASPTAGTTFQTVPLDFVPQPENLPTETETATAAGWEERNWLSHPIEWRFVGNPRHNGPDVSTSWDAWARPREPLVDDRAEQMAAFAYMSDNHSDWSAATRIENFSRHNFASLDNAVWIHRSLPWDDWWLVRSTCDVSRDGCAFSRRMVYARDGSLIATVAQEAFYAG